METAIALGDYDPFDQEWLSEEARARYDLSPCRERGSNGHNPYHYLDIRENGT